MTTATVPPSQLDLAVSHDLTGLACEAMGGEVLNRPGLHGTQVTLDPNRQILILVDSAGALAFYRDMVIGPAGYTFRLDVQRDSASVLNKRTRELSSGTVAEFRTRAELGPPDSLAALVLARCAEQGTGH